MICTACPKPIGKTNRSGLCRSCVQVKLNSDPEVAAKRKAGRDAYWSDPENQAAAKARAIRMGQNLPEHERERRRQAGLLRAPMMRQVNGSMTPEVRAENGRKRTDTMLAWCPPEWREKYREIKSRGRKAAEAKRIVLDLIAGRPAPIMYAKQKAKLAWCPPERRAEYERLRTRRGAAEARRLIEASLSPFERQLARVRAGAKLVTRWEQPRTEPSYTLGGVSGGML